MAFVHPVQLPTEANAYLYILFCSGLLESLCYSLYDVLRPVIIHINHLETLAEICSILKVRHVQ